MVTVKAKIGAAHFTTEIENDAGTMLLADEPVAQGGAGMGFSPTELFDASLAACTSITIRMYADRKGWPLDDVHVTIGSTHDDAKEVTYIERNIQLNGDLDEEQRDRLLQIADHCPLHKIMTNPIHIKTNVV
jgi:putative redox protein